MTRSDVWIADAVRAISALDVADEGTIDAVFGLCGLGVRRDVDVEPRGTDATPDEPGDTDLSEPAGPATVVDAPTTVGAAAAPPPAAAVPLLEPTQVASHNPWTAVAPMDLDAPPPPSRPLHRRDLFELPAARHLLADLTSTPVVGTRIDVPLTVNELARGRVLSEIPRLDEASLRRGVQLLLDRSAGMEPHVHEQQRLGDVLGKVVGHGKVQVLGFTELPLETAGAGPMALWGSYVVPEPGTPVLAVTDVGISGERIESSAELIEAWASLADTLRLRHSRLLVLIPYPPERWPRGVIESLDAVPWTERTTIQQARRLLQRRGPWPTTSPRASEEYHRSITAGPGRSGELIASLAKRRPAVVELAELLSLATRSDPRLLREIRLQAAPHLDVGVEADVWLSPIVRASDDTGFSFGEQHAVELRRRLAQRWSDPAAQARIAKVRGLIERAHASERAVVRLEEEVWWLALIGADDQIEARLAPVISALTQSSHSGLSYWASQAADRLPAEAYSAQSGWALAQLGSQPAPAEAAAPEAVPVGHVLATLPTKRVLVRYVGGVLQVGALGGRDLAAIEVPRVEPTFLTIEGRRHRLERDQVLEIPVSGPTAHIETAAGLRYAIEPAEPTPSASGEVPVSVSFGKRLVAHGFFVADDLVVAVAVDSFEVSRFDKLRVSHDPDAEQTGWVEAEHDGLAVVRLRVPADVETVQLSPTPPDLTTAIDWSSSDLSYRGSWLSPDEHTIQGEGLPGVPVVIEGQLVGVIGRDRDGVGIPEIIPASDVLWLVDRVEPRRQALVLVDADLFLEDDGQWPSDATPAVAIENDDVRAAVGRGGTLWCVINVGDDAEPQLKLTQRLPCAETSVRGRLVRTLTDLAVVCPDVDATAMLGGLLAGRRGGAATTEADATSDASPLPWLGTIRAGIEITPSQARALESFVARHDSIAQQQQLLDVAEFDDLVHGVAFLADELADGFPSVDDAQRHRAEGALAGDEPGDEEELREAARSLAEMLRRVLEPPWVTAERKVEQAVPPARTRSLAQTADRLIRLVADSPDLDKWVSEPLPDDEDTNTSGQLTMFGDDLVAELAAVPDSTWMIEPPELAHRDRFDEWVTVLDGEPNLEVAGEMLADVLDPPWRSAAGRAAARFEPFTDLSSWLTAVADRVADGYLAAARAAGAARMSTGRELAWLVTAMPAHFDSAGADSTARLDTLAGIFESGAATLVRRLGPELRARDSALPDVDETAVDAQTDGGGLSIELLPAGPSTCLLLSVGEPGSQRHMLVDAGGSRPAERVRGRLRDLRVDEVDVLVLTHIDSDAVAGAVRILEDPDLMVDEVWFNDRSGAAWGAMS